MLPFKELKNDIKNGYQYMVYEGKWYDMEYYIILEVDGIVLRFYDNKNEAIYILPVEEFNELKLYRDFLKVVNSIIYYNLTPIEEY